MSKHFKIIPWQIYLHSDNITKIGSAMVFIKLYVDKYKDFNWT